MHHLVFSHSRSLSELCLPFYCQCAAVLPRILGVLGQEVDFCVLCGNVVTVRALFSSNSPRKKLRPSETGIGPY